MSAANEIHRAEEIQCAEALNLGSLPIMNLECPKGDLSGKAGTGGLGSPLTLPPPTVWRAGGSLRLEDRRGCRRSVGGFRGEGPVLDDGIATWMKFIGLAIEATNSAYRSGGI